MKILGSESWDYKFLTLDILEQRHLIIAEKQHHVNQINFCEPCL